MRKPLLSGPSAISAGIATTGCLRTPPWTLGQGMYETHCAGCHGGTMFDRWVNRGDPEASLTDLDNLARRNGGRFPSKYLRSVVSGPDRPDAHKDLRALGEAFVRPADRARADCEGQAPPSIPPDSALDLIETYPRVIQED